MTSLGKPAERGMGKRRTPDSRRPLTSIRSLPRRCNATARLRKETRRRRHREGWRNIRPIHLSPAPNLSASSGSAQTKWATLKGSPSIDRSEIFKYPWLRVVEEWSGKTGTMDSRFVMVADHLLVEPRPGVERADFEKRIRAAGFTPGDMVGENGMLVSFDTRVDEPEELPLRIIVLEGLVEYAEPDYLVWRSVEPNDPDYTGNNNIGMTGVAWKVQLMAGRFLGPGGGTTSDGIKVIDYSRLNGAHIISASWGGGYSQALYNAIAACANADIPFVAAAGNSGTNNDSRPHYPSS